MSNKPRKQSHKHPPRGKHPAAKQARVKRERGWLLIAAIVFVILHSFLVLAAVYGTERTGGQSNVPAWFYYAIIATAIADIVAGVALWQWKKWGLTLYFIGTIVVIVLGILATGAAMMWSFSRLIPFVIVGYIVRSKWEFFE